MIRSRKPIKSTQQLKQEQINFLLEDVQKKLEEYEKAIALRDNQLAEAKKKLQGAKKRYNSVLKEKKQIKEYIQYIKKKISGAPTAAGAGGIFSGKNLLSAVNTSKKYKKGVLRRGDRQ